MLKNFLCVSIAMACVLAASQAFAGNGDLDPKFDVDGMATTAFDLGGDLHDTVRAGVVGKGGSTFLVGTASMDDDLIPDAIAIAKFQHDGKLDSTFGFGGRQLLTVPNADFSGSSGVSAATTPDGKLLVATTIEEADGQLVNRHGLLCRFNQTGFLDSTFGDLASLKGCTRVVSVSNNGNTEARIHAVAVRPDGGILLGGKFLTPEGVGAVGFAGLKKDGKGMDMSFGSNGYAVFSTVTTSMDSIHRIALTPDGGLMGLGRELSDAPLGDEARLVKVNAVTGVLSDDFGDSGFASLPLGVPDTVDQWAENFGFRTDGSIYVVGNTGAGNVTEPFVARLTPEGLPDVSFGAQGVFTFDNSPLLDGWLGDIEVFDDRIVLAGGWIGNMGAREWGVMALKHNGNVVSNFGETGESKIPFPGDASFVEAQGRRLMVAGTGWGAFQRDFDIARLDHGSKIIFGVSPVAAPNGTISPSGTKFVLDSNVAEFNIVPNPGFRVSSISGCEGGELIGTRYRTGPVTQSCTVKPAFVKVATLP